MSYDFFSIFFHGTKKRGHLKLSFGISIFKSTFPVGFTSHFSTFPKHQISINVSWKFQVSSWFPNLSNVFPKMLNEKPERASNLQAAQAVCAHAHDKHTAEVKEPRGIYRSLFESEKIFLYENYLVIFNADWFFNFRDWVVNCCSWVESEQSACPDFKYWLEPTATFVLSLVEIATAEHKCVCHTIVSLGNNKHSLVFQKDKQLYFYRT